MIYYFEEDRSGEFDAGYPVFFIVSKKYWNVNKCFDDCTPKIKMPKGFSECMESAFEFNGTAEEGTQKLLDAGFLPLPREN